MARPDLLSADPSGRHPIVRLGVMAWAVIGLALAVWLGLLVLDTFRLAIVPVALALFPMALLEPVSNRLRRRGWRPGLVAAVLILVFIGVLFGTLVFLAWLIANEIPEVLDALEEAYGDIRAYLDDRFGLAIPDIDDAIQNAQDWAAGQDLQAAGQSLVFSTLEFLSGVLLLLVVLFFYIKDGDRIVSATMRLVPPVHREDVAELGRRLWFSLGGYFRGQIVVAAVDAFFIGLGLFILDVPLALPLSVLVFFGGFFPIVGAFTAGALAVLVALADQGLGTAIAVLALNIVVQQTEGNLLEPIIVGRSTRLHPLLILVSLTAGAVTLGILGAFLAVPFTACVVRVVGFLLEKREERDGEGLVGTDDPADPLDDEDLEVLVALDEGAEPSDGADAR